MGVAKSVAHMNSYN